MLLANAAYDMSKLPSVTGVEIFRSTAAGADDHAAVAVKNGVAMVAIAGSDSAEDWLNNVAFQPTNDFHSGFYRGLHGMANGIMNSVLASNPERVFMAGHSRGGALLEILLENFFSPVIASGVPITCMTFGAPMTMTGWRVSNVPSKKQVSNVEFFRVVKYGDPVVKLPGGKLGYKHDTPAIFVGEKEPWWLRLRHFIRAAKGNDLRDLIMKNHVPEAYIDSIRERILRQNVRLF